MSVEIVDSIKKQSALLTKQEKETLANFFSEEAEKEDSSVETTRRKRAAWLEANREKYGGQYVALEGDRLIGVGRNYAEAAAEAKRAGVENAFIDFVPPTDYVGFAGGW
jgi:2-keto-4-pentenoate hydratase/2-oxohepta-3-ene-1,7-dioic acid hydratase in catechol pathway